MDEERSDIGHLGQLQPIVDNPREDMDVELKGWLDLECSRDRADVAKALLAMANHGGGYVVLGFTEEGERWVPDTTGRPGDLNVYSQDCINGIVQRYSDPPFHCDVHYLARGDTGDRFPVIVVPGGHTVPVRARRSGPDEVHVKADTYYVRRPGPCSESPRSADEWKRLINRCIRASRGELLELVRDLLSPGEVPGEGSNESFPTSDRLQRWIRSSEERWREKAEALEGDKEQSRYRYGTLVTAYVIDEVEAPQTAEEFRKILEEIVGPETGWPLWLVGSGALPLPYPFDGLVESWFPEASHIEAPSESDFWRVSPEGKAFLIRGLPEDSYPEGHIPGQYLDMVLPVWRAAEVLLHAARLAERISHPLASVEVCMSWRGLEGRSLVSAVNPNRWVREGRTCHQDAVTAAVSVRSCRILDTLPELVQQLTEPLHSAFDFFSPPADLYQEEIKRMRVA